MSGFLLNTGSTLLCPHAGQVSIITTNVRVKVDGQPAVTFSDTYLVSGCPFTIPPSKPQPCVKVQWLVPATRVRVGGQPVLLQSSSGLCQSAEQIPQGPPNVVMTQVRVKGT
ncbi:MAG: hypothetical protein D6681_17980 [Calditrichaeota bacterium]|nr:MAG: hypothetical protein D6681_17980 [Calditrichota bacterium]